MESRRENFSASRRRNKFSRRIGDWVKNAVKSFLKDFSPLFNGISTMRLINKSSVLVSLKYLIVLLSVGVRNSGE